MAFLPNGKRIVSGVRNGTIRIWDFQLGTEDRPPLREHFRSVEAVVISHDGRRIISGSRDQSIRIWDTDYSAKALDAQPAHSISATALAFTRDGAPIATGLKDGSIRLSVTGVEMLHPLEGHKGTIFSLSFSARLGCVWVDSSCYPNRDSNCYLKMAGTSKLR